MSDSSERLARIETKIDIIVERGDDTETRLRTLEKNQTRILAWVTAVAGTITLAGQSILKKLGIG